MILVVRRQETKWDTERGERHASPLWKRTKYSNAPLMATLNEIAKKEDVLLALEPEELALLVLQAIVAQEKDKVCGIPNRKNFSGGFKARSKPVQRAIMEAWAWLETSGAIAQPEPHEDSTAQPTESL